MTVKHVTGDIFDLDVDAIGHGVNCKGVMEAGIAVEFKRRYPAMFRAYNQLCTSELLHLGQVFVWTEKYKGIPYFKHAVYNIASQDWPGANADLEAIKVAVEFVRFDAERRGFQTVALPQIGCGIGGLEWENVSVLLDLLLWNSPVEFQLVTFG